MKKFKKVFVAVLTFILSVCMIGSVSAETATTKKGSITITGTTKEKVYEVYKIFNLTYSGEGDNLKVAYTIDTKWEGFFDGTGAKYIVEDNTGSLNAITVKTKTGYATKYINITETNVAEFATDALAYLGAHNITKTADKKATGETTTIDNLDLGYYLVYPEGATEINTEKYASIASLTSTTPTANVNIKATYPTINKTIKDNQHTYEVGTYAEFTITGKVPDTTGFTTYTYKIHDSWTKGLEYKEAGFNMVVTVGDDTVTLNSDNLTISDEGFTLTIDVKNKNYKVGDEIKVVYNLLVNSFAINSDTTNNRAYLEYSNNPQKTSTSTTTPIEVPVYSSSIEVLKVAGESCSGEPRVCTTKLAGAKFVLMNEAKTHYYKIAVTGWYQDENGKNIFSANDIEWVTDINDATVFTTNEDGIIETPVEGLLIGGTEYTINAFEGLKDGKYFIVETEAPAGYNKLAQPVEVVLNGSKNQNNKPIPVVKNVTIENNTGTTLPSTGGFGTKMFIIIGSLLAVVSAIVLVTNKRMSKEFI